MTDYHSVWGPSQNRWCDIDRGNEILTVLTVCAWVGMALFFVLSAFVLLTQSDAAVILMLLSLAFWITCGASAIRIRRGRRKFLTVQR
jgi:hypothetical protein